MSLQYLHFKLMETGISNSQGIKKALPSLDSPWMAVQRETPPKNKRKEKMMINAWIKICHWFSHKSWAQFSYFFFVF